MKSRMTLLGRLGFVPAFVVLATAASGCVVEGSFNPFGSDFTMDGSWLINGEVPTAALCTDGKATDVQLVFVEGSREYLYEELVFPCEQGSFDSADLGLSFRYGTYQLEWQAVDDSSAILARHPLPFLIVNDPTDQATLETADFELNAMAPFNPVGTDLELTGDWTINGGDPSTGCAAAGIENVEILFYADTDTAGANGISVAQATCSAGKYDSMPTKVIAYGSYLARYRGLAADGTTTVAETDLVAISYTAPADRAMLAIGDIRPPQPRLTVELSWDTDSGAGTTPADCSTAGVGTMSYMLTNTSSSTVVAMDSDVACAGSVVFEPIESGQYSLYVEGATTGGSKDWMGTCEALEVAGGPVSFSCTVNYTPPTP